MADLISRAAVANILNDMHGLCRSDVLAMSKLALDALPAVDAVPVEWLQQEAMKDDGLINSVIRGLLMKWQKGQEAHGT